MNVQRYKRGQIWWLKDESPNYLENVQSGTRPVIIVSNDTANRFSKNVTIVPCTTAEKKELPTHIKLEINGPSTALVENIRTVGNSNLTTYIGACDDELMERVNEAIKIALGLINTDKLEVETDINIKSIKTIEDSETNTFKSSRGRKKGSKKLSIADKIRFMNDYSTHDIEYMLKKYNIPTKTAVIRRYYYYKKAIEEDK